MKYLLFEKWPFLLLMVFLYGCASHISLDKYRNEWITRPLSELKQAVDSPDSYAAKNGRKETTYPLANGHFVYVEPFSDGCSLHWEVSSNGILVGCRTVGSGCAEELRNDNDMVRKLTAPSSW